ncbi:hypothetical protein ACWGRJ_46985, partial [Bradyrhizobium sp. Lot11]
SSICVQRKEKARKSSSKTLPTPISQEASPRPETLHIRKVRPAVDFIRVLVVTGNMKRTPFQSERTCRFSPLINKGWLLYQSVSAKRCSTSAEITCVKIMT